MTWGKMNVGVWPGISNPV